MYEVPPNGHSMCYEKKHILHAAVVALSCIREVSLGHSTRTGGHGPDWCIQSVEAIGKQQTALVCRQVRTECAFHRNNESQ